MRVSEEQLADLELMEKKATPGVWCVSEPHGEVASYVEPSPDAKPLKVLGSTEWDHNDEALALEARNVLSDLIADLRQARAIIKRAIGFIDNATDIIAEIDGDEEDEREAREFAANMRAAIGEPTEVDDGPCNNQDCPIGCPESHALPVYDGAE